MSYNKVSVVEGVFGISMHYKEVFSSLLKKSSDLWRGLIPCVINSNAEPFVQEGVSVKKHIGSGNVVWNKNKSTNLLFLSDSQKEKASISGYDFLEENKRNSFMNASVLDWFLDNQQHLPLEEWKGKKIFFWGTLYKSSSGGLLVRYLDCRNHHISWSTFYISDFLDESSFALLVE